ncbi:unnamed protein product, partial [Mesorhabditis belari]|uniref:Calcineurin-like phosphoesterase domain-containing protein n=1 Tax=Mesorhabditis belari TaxID=2138241 RepID=A0AAF3FR79_9BILA
MNPLSIRIHLCPQIPLSHRINDSPGRRGQSRREFWETIKRDNKTVIAVTLNDAVNSPDETGRWLKFVVISDTHDQLGEMMEKIPIPDGDVLIHCGDMTNRGEKEKLEALNEQFGQLPHKHKVVVAGNHDLGFDDTEDWSKRHYKYPNDGTREGYKLLTNVTWLHDKAHEIEGIKIYGSSWHPLRGYPFYVDRGEKMAAKWMKMPDEVDILITHAPPLGYLDTFGTERWGDYDLLQAIEKRNPKFHVFGHVHESYGSATNNRTTFINAAACLKSNTLSNKPIVFYMKVPNS